MSISSILTKIKKTVTTLVGAALVAGSLVATTPASAADVSTMKQPKDLVSIGTATTDYGRNGDLVVRGGWVYSLMPADSSYWYGSNLDNTMVQAALVRTKLSTFASSTPKTIFPMDHSATASSTATSGAVSSTYEPQTMDITPDGNTAFIVDKIKDQNYKIRIIKVDLSAATGDSATNLAGEVVAIRDNVYGTVTSITALSDSAFIFNYSGALSKVTLSGSTWTFGSVFANTSAFDVKVNPDGNLIVATSTSENIVLSVYNQSTTAIIGTSSTVAIGTYNSVHTNGGITIDPSNGDVLFVDNNGTRVRRAVFHNGNFDATAKYEALQGAMSLSATAMTGSAGSYTFTVASTTGVTVGSTVALGSVLANENMAYISTNGGNTMTVTSVTGTTITVSANSAPFTVNNGTLKSAELFVKKPLNIIMGLAFDGSVGGQGLLALDHGTSGSTTPAVGPTIMNFETHGLPGVGSRLSLSQYHKSFSANYSGPGVSNDIQTYEIYLYSGATLADAVAAAQTHTATANPACSYNGNGNSNISFNCYIVDGLTTGTYYAIAAKQIAFDGISSWTIPGANVNNSNGAASVAVDNTTTLALPADPDPAGPASPGFVHEGPTSTTALSLLGGAYQHLIQSDGRGGKFVAYKISNTDGGEYKIVHIKKTGEVDSSFGTAGVQTLSAQATGNRGSDRRVQLGWYDDGKFVYSDFDNATSTYNFSFATSNGTNGWSLTDAEGTSFCGANVVGEASTNISSMTLVPAASTDPMFIVNCWVSWRNAQYQSINLTYPIVAKLTADHTLTAVAAPLSQIDSYTTASTETGKVCLNNWAQTGSNVISDPNPGSSGTLFTVLYRANALSALTNGYRSCSGDMNATYVGASLAVKVDGTFTVSENGVPTTANGYPTMVGTGVTTGHNFYFWATAGWNTPTKIYKLNDSGVLDTAFGVQGAISMANPTCTGSYLTTAGIAENNSGDVYITNLNMMNTGSPRKLYATSQLLEKASGNTAEIGSTHISAPVTVSGTMNILTLGSISNYGIAYSGTAIDAEGNAFLNYYAGSTGIKSVKFDSFAGALATGEDYLDCPPAPFEAVTSPAPFTSYNPGAVVKMSDNSFFMYDIENSDKVSTTFSFSSNPKAGTFSNNEHSIDSHEQGFVVALGGGKVLVGGGTVTVMDQSTQWMPVVQPVRSVEIYDPSAAAGSRWTKLADATGTNILPDEQRQYARAKLLTNGKVLVYGGAWGMNDAPNSGARTSGLVITIGSGATSSVANVEFGANYTNIIPAGAGKWLLAGNRRDVSYLNITPVKTTKVFTEATNAVSAGPDLKGTRRGAIVVTLANGKTMIAGDACWGNCGMTEVASYDLYDPATNTITTTSNVFRGTSPNISPAFNNIGGAIELASGKVLLVPGTMGMSSTAFLMNTANNTFTDGDTPVNGVNNEDLFLVGEKVLIAGGSGNGQTTPWQVYTQPVVVEPLVFIADNRRILKGSTGNLTITSSQMFDLGAQTPSDTRLSVTYANVGAGTVLKSSVIVPSSKLKLDATKLKLTLALPTAAQMNAGAVGAITATIKQGTSVLGTVTIAYIATKDTPVFQGQFQPNVTVNVPGMSAMVPLNLGTMVGNGTPVLTYKSNTTKICSVNPMGQVTRIARGECQIVASQAADLGTNAASQTYKLNFLKSTSALAFGQATPAAGNLDRTQDDIPIVVTSTVDGIAADLDLAFAIDNDDKCSIDDEGVLNTLADGSCKVTVTYAGDANNQPFALERTYTIVTPSVESPGTVGGVIGDAVFEEKDDPSDDMLTTSIAPFNWKLKKTINFGRGFKILYTPVLKAKTTNVYTGVTLQPTITSSYIGAVTTTFIIPVASFAKAPAGWVANAKVGATAYQCVMAYGSKTQVPASKKIKTVVTKGKTCTLPALATGQNLQVKVKNNWTRLGQKKGSAVLTGQKRTAKINLQ